MNVIYATSKSPVIGSTPNSVFLAGPTPRSANVRSWRPSAIGMFEKMEFQGTIFVPEPADGHMGTWLPYCKQIEWEEAALNSASCIMFWVPREMTTMPGLTTNIEFGMWYESGKTLFGAPNDADNNRYLWHYVNKLKIPNSHTLLGAVGQAFNMAKSQPRVASKVNLTPCGCDKM